MWRDFLEGGVFEEGHAGVGFVSDHIVFSSARRQVLVDQICFF